MADFIPVGSSWLDDYLYDSGTLFVRFHDKQGNHTVTCMYEDVPLEMWIGLLEAPSKGKYFHQSGLYRWPYRIL